MSYKNEILSKKINSVNDSPWKIIIADDEEDVHAVTKLVLQDFVFDNRSVTLLNSFNEHDTKKLISENPDTCVIFLDVVMDRENSGIEIIKYIREELKNRIVRIVLRTGQPGFLPEDQAIFLYDINDYKEKSELTSKKLITTLVSSLRSYNDVYTLDNNRRTLESIISSSSDLSKKIAHGLFVNDVLNHLITVLTTVNAKVYNNLSGFAAKSREGIYKITSGFGEYYKTVNKTLEFVLPSEIAPFVNKLSDDLPVFFYENHFFARFTYGNSKDNLIYLKAPHAFSEWDKDIISLFCTNISIQYDNIGLSKEIVTTQKEVILTLGGIAEARSKETGNHVKRVAKYCEILGIGYRLPLDEVLILKQSSPMHDIGKIAIPDIILNKPGSLTPEEFDIMKTHTKIGYEMLNNSKRKIIQAASIIAYQHHEKYNGTGYPNKLSGEYIHIYGRICAIADVFDALGCDRIYKKAWSLEKILDYFKDERGKHFDPNLIDIFFNNLDEFVKIKDTFVDKPPSEVDFYT